MVFPGRQARIVEHVIAGNNAFVPMPRRFGVFRDGRLCFAPPQSPDAPATQIQSLVTQSAASGTLAASHSREPGSARSPDAAYVPGWFDRWA